MNFIFGAVPIHFVSEWQANNKKKKNPTMYTILFTLCYAILKSSTLLANTRKIEI